MSKVWFITGTSRGIGLEIAKAVLAAGDRVVATARNRSSIPLPSDERRLLTLDLDVTSPAQSESAVRAAVESFGQIDVLVNNAGYGQLGTFEELTVEQIEAQFSTNVFGLFNVTRALLPVMRRQRSGRIFNLSSTAGIAGSPGASIYCASKFAVEGFSEALAAELEEFGIGVTIVEPGPFRTDFLDDRSVRHATASITDYAQASARRKAAYDARNHNQGGDPARLAAALLGLVSNDDVPLRFAAGSPAVDLVLRKAEGLAAEVARFRDLSASTDWQG
jgi:NAD(P)-dependent dehydrogenase (short-subunit alcohol dehydrogenase family)